MFSTLCKLLTLDARGNGVCLKGAVRERAGWKPALRNERAGLAGSRFGWRGERRAELAGGEVLERLEAANELGADYTAFTVEQAQKSSAGCSPLRELHSRQQVTRLR
jgi:hypothetical protein